MRHFADPGFWEHYQDLDPTIQRLADQSFQRLKSNPNHPSLRFKSVGRYWSVRVGLQYRALGLRDGNDLVWFWIGSHAQYDELLR